MNNGMLEKLQEEFSNMVERHRQRLDQMRDPKWEPIATADKTQNILVAAFYGVPTGVIWDGDHWRMTYGGKLEFEPTHWMPLPGFEPDEELLAEQRNQQIALAELIKQQGRAMAYMAGEKVEPQVHFAESVLVAKMGDS